MRRDITVAAGVAAATLAIGLGYGLSTGLSGSASAPAMSASPAPATASVTCGSLGQVSLLLSGTVDQPVATGVHGSNVIHVVAANTPGAVSCTPPRTLPALAVRVVADVRPAATSSSSPSGESSATSPATAAAAGDSQDPAGYGPVVGCPKDSGVQAYLDAHPGAAAVAWRPTGSQTIYSCSNGTATYQTASIVKLQVLAALFYQAEQDGRELSAWEKSQIEPMIRESDNDATTALWQHVGGAEGVAPVLARMGLRSTTPNDSDYWGLTTTTASDQVVLVDHFARHNPIISDELRDYALQLMRSVEPDQDWGITAGPGEGTAVKNGWLPTADEWIVNSTGYSAKAPQPYAVAVLTTATNSSMEAQIATIEGASKLVWSANENHPVSPASLPAAFHGIKGDQLYSFPLTPTGEIGNPVALPGGGWSGITWFGSTGDVDGDGLGDLAALDSHGDLWLYRGSQGGGFTRARRLGSGWGALSLPTAAGDITGDGIPELLARDATGQLLRYTLPRTGQAVLQGVVGTDFGPIVQLLPASIDGDGRGDLFAITRTGVLRTYRSQGTHLVTGKDVGTQWAQGLSTSVADASGSRRTALALQAGGSLRIYPVLAGGTLGAPVQSKASAAGFRLIG